MKASVRLTRMGRIISGRDETNQYVVTSTDVCYVEVALPRGHTLIVKPTDVDVPVVMEYPNGEREALMSVLFDDDPDTAA